MIIYNYFIRCLERTMFIPRTVFNNIWSIEGGALQVLHDGGGGVSADVKRTVKEDVSLSLFLWWRCFDVHWILRIRLFNWALDHVSCLVYYLFGIESRIIQIDNYVLLKYTFLIMQLEIVLFSIYILIVLFFLIFTTLRVQTFNTIIHIMLFKNFIFLRPIFSK